MVQVILRYIFSRPLFWAEEISVQLLVFMTLFGLSVLVQKKQLISIDLLSNMMRGKLRSCVEIFLSAISLIIIAIITRESIYWVMRPEVQMELSPTTQIPIWYIYSILPIAMSFMFIHQLVGLIEAIASAMKRGAK
jgi:TRAP-type C4-dicarboxylate transport system permease small subunit